MFLGFLKVLEVLDEAREYLNEEMRQQRINLQAPVVGEFLNWPRPKPEPSPDRELSTDIANFYFTNDQICFKTLPFLYVDDDGDCFYDARSEN